MRIKENKRVSKGLKIKVVFGLIFIAISAIVLSAFYSEKYNLQVGDIAKTSIKATRDVEDKEATENDKEKVIQGLTPAYKVNTAVKEKSISKINDLIKRFDDARKNKKSAEEIADSINEIVNMNLQDIEYVLTSSDENYTYFKDKLKEGVEFISTFTIRSDEVNSVTNVEAALANKVRDWPLTNEFKNILLSSSGQFIVPNAILDEEKTQELKDEALKKVQPIMIKKDQIIVKEGEPVEQGQLKILETLGLVNSSLDTNFTMYVCIVLVVLFILIIQYIYIYKFKRYIYKDPRKFTLMFVLVLLQVLLARVGQVQPYLIPLGAVPILMILMLDYETSIVINTTSTILIALVTGFDVQIMIIFIANIILSGIALRKLNARNDIVYSAVIMAIFTAGMNLLLGNVISNNFIEVLQRSGYIFLGGILTAIIAIGALPFLETMFNIVTNIKLLELSNPNNPLIKRIILEAPGTYHHSLMVGNLAEFAAEEVGANAVLTRVGAFYHDIGKITKPMFFKENQMAGVNPHDNLSPKVSAMVIISHVTEGIRLAKEYKLPESIVKMVAEHHGDDLVKYFYITERNNSENPDDVNKEDFRYPGSKPSSKETAIVMLADGVEASVRSIKNPTIENIQEMVEKIVSSKLNEGQLSESDLTLRDITKIKSAFMKVLTSMYHQRIEYPEDKNAKETK